MYKPLTFQLSTWNFLLKFLSNGLLKTKRYLGTTTFYLFVWSIRYENKAKNCVYDVRQNHRHDRYFRTYATPNNHPNEELWGIVCQTRQKHRLF